MAITLDPSQLDLVYISYDEPRAERTFAEIQRERPSAKRVHGVKGFNAAHRAAGLAAETDWVITVDGDTAALDWHVLGRRLDLPSADAPCILSFHARNKLNGLVYGNGGVKLWPRTMLLEMRTHEAAADGRAATEFCWTLPWYRLPAIASEIDFTTTPLHAFRAGFREAVKLCSQDGLASFEVFPDLPLPTALERHLWIGHRQRLRVWCSVGADVPNGLVAIYGARLGAAMLHFDDWQPSLINDFDWFRRFWFDVVYDRLGLGTDSGRRLTHEIEREGRRIGTGLGLHVTLLEPEASRFFKEVRPESDGREGFIDQPVLEPQRSDLPLAPTGDPQHHGPVLSRRCRHPLS